MKRSSWRRIGGSFLFLAWIQVATANALPCAVSCLLDQRVAHHHHPGMDEDHALGHHTSGAKISSSEQCGTPQLMVVAVAPPDFPASPSVDVVMVDSHIGAPAAVPSAVRENSTPPPRA